MAAREGLLRVARSARDVMNRYRARSARVPSGGGIINISDGIDENANATAQAEFSACTFVSFELSFVSGVAILAVYVARKVLRKNLVVVRFASPSLSSDHGSKKNCETFKLMRFFVNT